MMGYVYKIPESIKETSLFHDLSIMKRATDYDIKKCARAKYYITPEGGTTLACVEYMTTSPFRIEGYERHANRDSILDETFAAIDKVSMEFMDKNAWRAALNEFEWDYIREFNAKHAEKGDGLHIDDIEQLRGLKSYKSKVLFPACKAYRQDRIFAALAAISDVEQRRKAIDRIIAEEESEGEEDPHRATRRAKMNVFDLIMCNPELDTFCTFTYAPERCNRFDYDACYEPLRVWLSNRVQRYGLMYVIVFEKHKSGAYHFHAIMNSSALKLVRARYPNGRAISRDGKPVYHVEDWPLGFTTAQLIGGEASDRTAVSKYIFKYMGKSVSPGEKIGGRYALIGGKLRRPIYRYGDKLEDLEPEDTKPVYTRAVNLCGGSIKYVCHHFI